MLSNSKFVWFFNFTQNLSGMAMPLCPGKCLRDIMVYPLMITARDYWSTVNHEPAKMTQPICGSAWLLTAHGLHFGSAGALSRQLGFLRKDHYQISLDGNFSRPSTESPGKFPGYFCSKILNKIIRVYLQHSLQ